MHTHDITSNHYPTVKNTFCQLKNEGQFAPAK
jgi:hypothetical protein